MFVPSLKYRVFAVLCTTMLFACKPTTIRGVQDVTLSDIEALAEDTNVKISSSWYHTCAIVNTAGEVYCWGENFANYLGDNSSIHRPTPVKVLGITGASYVGTGQTFGCAIVNGDVYCWGARSIYNTLGDNGAAGTSTTTAPVKVLGLPAGKVTAISTGSGMHSCAIADGAAYCWGYKQFGQLGDGSGDGTGATNSGSIAVPVTGLGSGVTAIAAGDKHSCAVQNGAVKCWGLNCKWTAGVADCSAGNNYGQLGDNNASGPFSTTPVQVSGILSGATRVALGQYFSCAVVDSGVKCWGAGGSGRLGDGTATNSAVPLQVIPAASGATDVTAGLQGACANVNGTMKCWGYNMTGQVGNGTNGGFQLTPVDVTGINSTGGAIAGMSKGSVSTCAIHNARLKCWGSNTTYGAVGDGSGVEQDFAAFVQQTW